MPNHFNLREKGKETLTTFNYHDPDLFVPLEAVRHLKSRRSAGHRQPLLVAGGSQTWKVLSFPLITSTLEIPDGVALIFLSSSSPGAFWEFRWRCLNFARGFCCKQRTAMPVLFVHVRLPITWKIWPWLQNVTSSFEPLNPQAAKELSHTSLVTSK